MVALLDGGNMTAPQRYQVIAQVATTRTGRVWQARDLSLDRLVALKEIPVANADAMAALHREGAALAALASEHVVAAYGIEQDGEHAYLVEEWVDGATVAAVLRHSGPMPTAMALGVVRGALLGLAAAHRAGLVHGDVSMSNILVDATGTARLIDFGSVVAIGGLARPATGAFAAPEVLAGGPATPAADVFAAAAVLASLLHGRTETTPSVRGIDRPVRDVLSRALDPAPERRYSDASVFLSALEEAATRAYGASWWTQAGLGAAATGSVAALVPMVGAAGVPFAVAGAGASAAAGTGGASATAAAQAAGGTAGGAGSAAGAGGAHTGDLGTTAGQRTRRTAWRSRRTLIIGGVVAAVVAGGIAVAVATTSNDSPSHPTPIANAPATTSIANLPTSSVPTGPGSSGSASGGSIPSVGQTPFTSGSGTIGYRLVSTCGNCTGPTVGGLVKYDALIGGSGVDQNGLYNAGLTSTSDANSVLAVSGSFAPGQVKFPQGVPWTAPDLGFSIVFHVPDSSGSPLEVAVSASTTCNMTITVATQSDLAGYLQCGQVSTADPKYVYAVGIQFTFSTSASAPSSSYACAVRCVGTSH
jgi:hypothetical protein